MLIGPHTQTHIIQGRFCTADVLLYIERRSMHLLSIYYVWLLRHSSPPQPHTHCSYCVLLSVLVFLWHENVLLCGDVPLGNYSLTRLSQFSSQTEIWISSDLLKRWTTSLVASDGEGMKSKDLESWVGRKRKQMLIFKHDKCLNLFFRTSTHRNRLTVRVTKFCTDLRDLETPKPSHF